MHFTLRVLQEAGYPVRSGLPICDLGCGAGKVVRELRKEGLDAYGCDFHFGKDKEGAANALEAQGVLRRIATDPYRLPFDDGSISYVISETVMEHVANLDATLAELARILRDDGACLHFFPARLSPIEPHIGIPFGGVAHAYPYLLACSALGLRRRDKKNRPLRQRARDDQNWLRRRTFYLTERQIVEAYGRHFGDVRFVEEQYFAVSGRPRVSRLARLPGAARLYRTFRAAVLLTAKPIRRSLPAGAADGPRLARA